MFSPEWNEIYARGEQDVRWPWTDLVSLVKRYLPELKSKYVLELGCGRSAPNARFFVEEGAIYHGIDGAVAAPEAHGTAGCGILLIGGMDFTKRLPPGPFDLIFDRAAITHNDTESIQRTLNMVREELAPGGYFIGVDWFGAQHQAARWGDQIDQHTRTAIPIGQFAGCGVVHFTTKAEIARLFKGFELLEVQHKVIRSSVRGRFAAYNIVATIQ